MKRFLFLILFFIFAGCVHVEYNPKEKPSIPLGTHTNHEWEVVHTYGRSMYPYISNEDVIIMEPWDSPKLGKVYVYKQFEGHGVMHRAVRVSPQGYIMKGSNNKVDDGWYRMKEDNYRGAYAYTVEEYNKWLEEQR